MSNTLLLYVTDPAASAAFYRQILGRPPVEQSPGFALFALGSGLALGLWRKDRVAPAAASQPGACDLGFKVDPAQIDQTYAEWRAMGVTVLMPPTDLDFGRSFVVADPDRHRLRVYALAGDGAA